MWFPIYDRRSKWALLGLLGLAMTALVTHHVMGWTPAPPPAIAVKRIAPPTVPLLPDTMGEMISVGGQCEICGISQQQAAVPSEPGSSKDGFRPKAETSTRP